MSNFTVYRSSAGSGKTHTLVKEYIRLSITGNDYQKRFARILAITFTNKAAGEMKERVIKNLYLLKLDPSHKQYNSGYIEEMVTFCGMSAEEIRKRAMLVFSTMLHNYHLLKITTIDKFTVSLVYSFARDLNIDADHEIVTDVNEVIDAGVSLLIEQSGRDKELTDMFIDFLGFEMEEGNRFNARKELRKFCSKVMNEKGYEALGLAGQYTEAQFVQAGKTAAIKISAVDQQVEDIAGGILEKIKNAGIQKEDFHFKGLGNYTWLENISKEGFFKIKEAPRIADFIAGKRWQKTLDPSKEIATKALGDDIAGAMVALIDLRKKELRDYLIHSTVRHNAFSMALFKRLYQSIQQYKQDNSVILLSEFTQLVSDVVAQEPAPFIFERLGERVKNIFVDEFQDTSSLQFSNLVPLMENSLSVAEFVMLVGDAKQSIYRWRDGNVEQYVSLPALPPQTLSNHPSRQKFFGDQYAEKNLPVNYRSFPTVVEFNNCFFRAITGLSPFNAEGIQLAYKDLEQKCVETKSGGYVKFNFIMSSKKHENSGVTETEEENGNHADERLNFALDAVQQCLKNGYAYGDIAILVRVHTDGEKVFTHLRRNGIPVVSNQALGLGNSLEIKALVSLFAVLHQLGDFTTLKQFAFDYACYRNELPKNEKHIASISTTGSIAEVLNQFGVRVEKSVFDSLNLFEQFHYLAHALGMPVENAFLTPFYELIFGFFRRYGSNPGFFLTWWEQKALSAKLQTGEGSDSVQIVTIHKSKGLQYPVVIMPFVNTLVKTTDKFFWLKNVPGYEIKPLPVQYGQALGDTEWNTEYETEKQRSAFDVLNLLYVGFTRAEEQLFCCTSFSLSSINKDPLALALKESGWNGSDQQFAKGQPVIRTKVSNQKQKADLSSTNMQRTSFISWFNKIKVSTHMVSEELKSGIMRKKGILLHDIASRIYQENEIPDAVSGAVLAGLMNEQEAAELSSELKLFFGSEKFKTLIQPATEQWMEVDLTDGLGGMYRPDRVIVYPENQSVIIDLKAGDIDEEHELQVARYAMLLNGAGFPVKEAWLFYFKQHKWIKVELPAS